MILWISLTALLALVGIIGGWLRWRYRPRTPSASVETDPSVVPVGLSPGSARYVFRGGYDARCIAAELVDMAIRGHLQVGREARVVGFRWRVQRLPEASTEGLMPIQRALAERLRAEESRVGEEWVRTGSSRGWPAQ